MENKKFGVLIFTYNRNSILKECLESIRNQTYQNFEVVVIDRGSEPSAQIVIEEMKDHRFNYVKSSQDVDRVDSGNEIIKNWDFDYFVNPGDDDIYLPNAFKLIKMAFDSNIDAEFIQIGMVPYSASKKFQETSKSAINIFNMQDFYDNNLIIKYDGKKLVKRAFVIAKLGDDIEHYPAAHPQPTALFLTRKAIDRIWEKQKGLFIKTYWDAGSLIIAWTNEIIYLNLPLAVFTVNCATRDTVASRRRWKKECLENEYLKIKVAHGLCCGTDTMLKVLYRNNLEKEYNAYLRFDFYLDIFWDILNDEKFDIQTIKDLLVIFVPLILYPIIHPVAFVRFALNIGGNPKETSKRFERIFIKPIVLYIRKLLKITKKNKIEHDDKNNSINFEKITDWMKYLETEFKDRNINLEEQLKGEMNYAKK